MLYRSHRLTAILIIAALWLILLSSCAKVENGRVVPESLAYGAMKAEVVPVERSMRIQGVGTWEDTAHGNDEIFWVSCFDVSEAARSTTKAFVYASVASLFIVDQKTYRFRDNPGLLNVWATAAPLNTGLGSHFFVKLSEEYHDHWTLLAYSPRTTDTLFCFSLATPLANAVFSDYPVWRVRGGDRLLVPFLLSNKQRGPPVHDTLLLYDCTTRTITKRVLGTTLVALRQGGYAREREVRDSLIVLFGVGNNWAQASIDNIDDRRQQLVAFRSDASIEWIDTLDNGSTRTKTRLAIKLLGGDRIVTGAMPVDSAPGAPTLIELHDAHTGHRLKQITLPESIVQMQSYRGKAGAERIACISADGAIVALDSDLHVVDRRDLDVPCRQWNGEQLGATSFDLNGDAVNDLFLVTALNQTLVLDGTDFTPLLAIDDSVSPEQVGIIRARGKVQSVIHANQRTIDLLHHSPHSFISRLGPHRTPITMVMLLVLLASAAFFTVRRIDYLRTLFGLLTAGSDTHGIITADARARLRSINGAARDMLALPREPARAAVGDLPTEITAMIHAVLASGKEMHRELILGAGDPRYLTVEATPLGSFARRRGCMVTITEATAHVESELRRNVLLFARSKAHDAKQPLATLALRFDAMMGTLRREGLVLPPAIAAYEENIRRELAETGDQVRAIMYLANVAEFTPVRCDVGEVVQRWLDAHRERYERAGVAIELLCDRTLPSVDMDTGHFGTMLQCIVDNAAEAMAGRPERRITITISASGRSLVFACTDTGSGMDAGTLERVRTRPYFTTRSNGSGFGMKIIRKVCEEHGAVLRIESRPGGGTRVEATFPVANDECRVTSDE